MTGARTWLHLIVLQHSSSRGKGKSLRVVDKDSICRERLLGLTQHPNSNAFDAGVAAQVELITLQAHADASLAMLNSLRDFSRQGADIIKGFGRDIQRLHSLWDQELGKSRPLAHPFPASADHAFAAVRPSDPFTPFVGQCMARTFKQAELEVIVGGIRGRSIRQALTDLTFRDLVVQARTLAMENLELLSSRGDALLSGMTHSMVLEASFCALLVLKVTKVLPEGVELDRVIRQIRWLSEVSCPLGRLKGHKANLLLVSDPTQHTWRRSLQPYRWVSRVDSSPFSLARLLALSTTVAPL